VDVDSGGQRRTLSFAAIAPFHAAATGVFKQEAPNQSELVIAGRIVQLASEGKASTLRAFAPVRRT
jgi:hypothetical protein